MTKPRKAPRTKRRPAAPAAPADPYRDHWLELTPFERLERSWRLRKRIPDLQAVHDAKLFPRI